MAVTAYLGLGSNLGDREGSIKTALSKIGALPQTELRAVSSFIQTKADGFEGPDFINCCCSISTGLEPFQLLEAVKMIEADMGRSMAAPIYDADGRRIYSSRPIDIDILLYGNLQMDDPQLQIPHPRMHERDFVMIPLNEIRNR